MLARLLFDADRAGDAQLFDLHKELSALPGRTRCPVPPMDGRIAVPLMLRAQDGTILSLLSTTTVFGTAVDVTLAELTLECFYPADEQTRQALMS